MATHTPPACSFPNTCSPSALLCKYEPAQPPSLTHGNKAAYKCPSDQIRKPKLALLTIKLTYFLPPLPFFLARSLFIAPPLRSQLTLSA